MGGCIRANESVSEPRGSFVVSSSVDNPYGYNVILINESYLFYIVRKEIYNALKGKSPPQTEFIDLRNAKEFAAQHCYLSTNTEQQLEPSVKVLYDFRNIVLFDDETKGKNYQLTPRISQLLARFKELKVAPTAVLVCRWPAKVFLKNFPFFTESAREPIDRSLMARLNIPILVFDSEELSEKMPRARIYLHSQKMHAHNTLLEPNFYSQNFDTKKIVDVFCTDNIQAMSESSRIDELKRTVKGLRAEGGTVVVLHRLTEHQDQLVKIMMRVLCDAYQVGYNQGLLYFSEKFPNFISKATDEERQQVIFSTKQIRKDQQHPATKAEELQRLLLRHYMECSRDQAKTSRAYSLCLMLLQNICKEDGNDSYRQIKTTNAQLGEHLFKYGAGRRLLEGIGFFPQSGNIYRNDMEVKYLKTYRTDLELAYRKFDDAMRQGRL